jgi:hypothetical protein
MKTVAERIENSITRVPEAGCWLWEKSVTGLGYARMAHHGKARAAHRLSFEAFKGEIPEGLEIDHTCKVRSCVNPDHLEAVTRHENMLRSSVWTYRKTRTHCPKGHELTGDNVFTSVSLGNKYLCLACKKQRSIKAYLKGK